MNCDIESERSSERSNDSKMLNDVLRPVCSKLKSLHSKKSPVFGALDLSSLQVLYWQSVRTNQGQSLKLQASPALRLDFSPIPFRQEIDEVVDSVPLALSSARVGESCRLSTMVHL
jgi:hypothetical protein